MTYHVENMGELINIFYGVNSIIAIADFKFVLHIKVAN